MAALSQWERVLRHGGHGGDGRDRGRRGQRSDGAARSVETAGTVDGRLQLGLADRSEGAVGGEVLGQQGLDHLQGDGREVVLSDRGDLLPQVLRLVGADGVDGGQEVLGGRQSVGGQQAAVVSCRGSRGGPGGFLGRILGRTGRAGPRVTVVLDVRL